MNIRYSCLSNNTCGEGLFPFVFQYQKFSHILKDGIANKLILNYGIKQDRKERIMQEMPLPFLLSLTPVAIYL
jgi:hypothetical protein